MQQSFSWRVVVAPVGNAYIFQLSILRHFFVNNYNLRYDFQFIPCWFLNFLRARYCNRQRGQI